MENEIRKSDRGVLMEVVSYLCSEPYPAPETLKMVKAGIEAHLEATKGEYSSWETQSRQLIAETEAETARLLATKFVADEAVGLVGELVAALANAAPYLDELEADNYDDPSVGIFKDHDLTSAINVTKNILAKAAQFTAAGTAPTVGGASEPVIFPPDEVEAVPEFVPDWAEVPDGRDAVAVDKDGAVFCYTSDPFISGDIWNVEGNGFYYLCEITPPPGETWQKMVYKRPS